MNPLFRGALRATVIACAASMAAQAALADTSVSATLESATFDAIFDGTGAGFVPSTQATYVYVYDPAANSVSSADWTSDIGLSLPGAAPSSAGTGEASATTEAATATGSPFLVNVDRFAQFTLLAGQSLQASIDYSLSFSGAASLQPGQTALSSVELQVLGFDGSDYTQLLQQSTQSLTSDDTGMGTLSVDFTNTGEGAQTYRLALNANSQISVAAVPEPASATLMLAGGLALSLLAARRRRPS